MEANFLLFEQGSSAWVDSHLMDRYFRSSETRLHLHRDGLHFRNGYVDGE